MQAFGLEFDDIEPNDERLIKVNLTDCGSDSEGIWAYVGEKTKALYDKNHFDKNEFYPASTANATLHGVPWGAYIPIKLNGEGRPTSDMSIIKKLSTGPVFNKVQWENAVGNVLKALESDKPELDERDFKYYSYVLGAEHNLVIKLKQYVKEA